MLRLYQRLSDEPSLLFGTLHEDDAHSRRFNKSADNKTKLRDLMRKATAEIDAMLRTLFAMGKSGNLHADVLKIDHSVKISRKHRQLLGQLGLRIESDTSGLLLSHPQYPDMFAAMTWLASRPTVSLLPFSRCLFCENHAYAREIYARLSGNPKAFGRLESYLIDHDYISIDQQDDKFTLDYCKPLGNKMPTKGGFLYGINHTGFSASYDPLMDSPPVYGLCIPRMKELLTAFDDLPVGVQDFVVSRTKKCDGCRYCVQTDKTGNRPLANLPINHGGTTYRLCPYFPGYSYCWTELNDDLVNNMIEMLQAMDVLFQL